MDKQLNNKDIVNKGLFYLGYITLMGPPRASYMHSYSTNIGAELYSSPLWVVLMVETAVRGAFFIMLGYLVESIVGVVLFAKFHGDNFLKSLMVLGGIHVLAYFIGIGIIAQRERMLGMFIYRIGRNFSYAFVVALFSELSILTYQYVNDIKLFSGSFVEQGFMFTLEFFIILGSLEAFYRRNRDASTLTYIKD
jgi:hypothetical protein